MIRLGNQQEVEEYFADSSINQSYLKSLLRGVDFIGEDEKKMYYEEKGHFIIGSAVDVYITQGVDSFQEQYYKFEGEKPSDAMISMTHYVFDRCIVDDQIPAAPLSDFIPLIEEALELHKYQARWKQETRINKVLEACENYFSELKLAHGKQILSKAEVELISSIIMSLRSHKHTAEYFKSNGAKDIYYQVPIYFMLNEIPCKALLDMLIVHRDIKMLEPIDLKTMGGSTITFPYAVKARRYDFQGAFYNEAVHALKNYRANCDIDFGNISDFGIMNFKFIVETTETKKNTATDEVSYMTGRPLVYGLSTGILRQALVGRPEIQVQAVDIEGEVYPIDYKKIDGVLDALDLYRWHSENGFETDRKVVESNGIIEI